MASTKRASEDVIDRGWFPPPEERRCWLCREARPLDAFRRPAANAPAVVRGVCKPCLEHTARTGRRPTRTKDPRTKKIRLRTRAAIRNNELVPKPCEHCGAAKVIAYYPSLNGRNAHLNVLWLCRKHLHAERSRREQGRQLELVPPPPF